ncbi:uncharacterized protein FFMR_09642 [Fusarium fujikuroi]|nr:uncharacterized protein FFMR_09642 [Fusarium fujikuroi]
MMMKWDIKVNTRISITDPKSRLDP